jgi:type I restriction enzyme S subunit
MSPDLNPIRFGNLLSEVGIRNGIYKAKEFHGRGAKIVNMGELFAYPRLFDIPMKRVEVDEDERRKFSLQAGDLLFARRSLVAEGAGKCSIVKAVNEATVFESSIIRARVDQEKADSDFLYYTLSSPLGRNLLGTILRQTAVSGITGTDLVELEIPLPPLPKQKAIAHILGTLDDKIELNRKTNETLEAMAKALFKSWFVDFDPVRAKAEGRPTGLPDEISDLFPDSFEDSELGEIPSGWEVKALDDVAHFLNGLALQKFPPQEGDPTLPGPIRSHREGVSEVGLHPSSLSSPLMS